MASNAMVLVAGGFLGPWIWEGVEEQLRAAGFAAVGSALASVPQHDDPHPAVARLVYLAGAAPDAGESLADLAPEAQPASSGADTSAAEQVHVRPDGAVQLSAGSAIAGLFNDCGQEAATRAAALLRPMNPVVNTQPVTAAAWRQLPASFVRCTYDKLPELLSDGFLTVVDDVVELPTGHCPQWSRPDLVANLLLERAC